jgi:hypothetical protein
MLVAVTLVALGFGYELNWIGERHSLIDVPEQTGVLPEYESITQPLGFPALPVRVEMKDAPWPLRWLGERGIHTLNVPDDMPEEKVSRIRAIFPEADIERVPLECILDE